MDFLNLLPEIRLMVYRELGLNEIKDTDLFRRGHSSGVGIAKTLRAVSRGFRDEVDAFMEREGTLSISSYASFVRLARVHDTFARHCGTIALDVDPGTLALIVGNGSKDAATWDPLRPQEGPWSVEDEVVVARLDHACAPVCVCHHLCDLETDSPSGRLSPFLNLRRLDINWPLRYSTPETETLFCESFDRILARLATPIPLRSLERVRFCFREGKLGTPNTRIRVIEKCELSPRSPGRLVDWPMPPEPIMTEEEREHRKIRDSDWDSSNWQRSRAACQQRLRSDRDDMPDSLIPDGPGYQCEKSWAASWLDGRKELIERDPWLRERHAMLHMIWW